MQRRQGWALAAALAVSLWVLLPIYLIAASAFSTQDAVYQWPKAFWPSPLSMETLRFFFSVEGVWKATRNSLIVAGLTVLLSALLGTPAGYALARFTFRGQGAFRMLILMTRAFPLVILSIPLAQQFLRLGMYDTAFSVALVHTALTLPFSVLISASVFMGIPKELEEAAWTLGCSPLQAFRRIVAPLALPGLAAAAVFSFVTSWNEVFAASVLTLRERTLTAYLLSVLGEAPLPFRFAGGFFLVIPALIFLFLIRRYLFSVWGIASR